MNASKKSASTPENITKVYRKALILTVTNSDIENDASESDYARLHLMFGLNHLLGQYRKYIDTFCQNEEITHDEVITAFDDVYDLHQRLWDIEDEQRRKRSEANKD